MQKPELTALVDTVCSNWNRDDENKINLYRTWWRYLSDLDYDATLKVVDGLIVSGTPWMPRVGDVRRAVIDLTSEAPPLPQDEVAWSHAEARWNAVALGVEPPITGSPATDEAIGSAMRLAGRPDRRAFIEAWEQVRSEIDADRYGIPEQSPGLMK